MHTYRDRLKSPRLRDSPLGAGGESRNLGKDFSRSLYKSEISFTSIGNPSVEGFRVFMGLDILDGNSSAGGFGNPCSLRIRIPPKKFENPDSGIPQLEDSGNAAVYGIGRRSFPMQFWVEINCSVEERVILNVEPCSNNTDSLQRTASYNVFQKYSTPVEPRKHVL